MYNNVNCLIRVCLDNPITWMLKRSIKMFYIDTDYDYQQNRQEHIMQITNWAVAAVKRRMNM